MNNSSELFIKISHLIVENPKIIVLSCEARWAFIESLVYAARNMTDGLIDRRVLHKMWSDSVIVELSQNDDENPSWQLQENGDVIIHGFSEWQMTNEKRAEIRQKRVDAGVKSGEVRRANKTRTNVQQVFEQNANKSELETETETETDKKHTGYSSEFESWWKLYPRKTAKGIAYKAFNNALDRVTFDELMAKTETYANGQLPEERFIPHPGTWLNADRWNDEVQRVEYRHHPPEDDWMYPNFTQEQIDAMRYST